VKPSIFSLIFRDFTLDEAIPAIAKIGYQGVELMGRPPHLPPDTAPARVREIRRLVDDHGLVVAGIAGYAGSYSQADDAQARAQLDDLARQLEMADALGCRLIRHHAGGPSYDQATEAQWQRAVEGMQTAADLAGRAGVRLVNELHPNGIVETADSAADFLKRVDRANVGVVLDPGNMYLAGTPCGAGEVYKLWGRIFHVHVKDCLRVSDAAYPTARPWRGGLTAFKVLGEGAVDHLPAFRALTRLGYRGFLSCECEIRWPSKEAVLLCAEHEHRVLTQLVGQAAG
jgi:L-ribulose-5-phosphate 3-epimerase